MRLLLLHALPLDWRMWQAQANLLPEATLAPDLYRFGNTLVDWATGVLEEVGGNDELVVVGCSVGGSCALEVAAAAPERVAAIVLVEAKAGHRPEPAFRDEAIRVIRTEGMAVAWDRYWAPLFSPHTPADVVHTARDLAMSMEPSAVVRGVEAFHGRDDRAALVRAWPKPLAVIAGDHGRPAPPSRSEALAASAPRGEFHLVERCGHYVNLEQPAAFERIVTTTLTRWFPQPAQ